MEQNLLTMTPEKYTDVDMQRTAKELASDSGEKQACREPIEEDSGTKVRQ